MLFGGLEAVFLDAFGGEELISFCVALERSYLS